MSAIERRRARPYVVGVDEVGTGAWAGPIYVGAFLCPGDFRLDGLRDSKRLSPGSREKLCDRLMDECVHVILANRSAQFLREHGQSRAWNDCVFDAVVGVIEDAGVGVEEVEVVLDGTGSKYIGPRLSEYFGETVLVRALPKADTTVPAVSGASVVAKVHRDWEMMRIHDEYPWFGWAENKGYGTADHADALTKYGPVEYHREHAFRTFGGM